jgi:hypothetical protein
MALTERQRVVVKHILDRQDWRRRFVEEIATIDRSSLSATERADLLLVEYVIRDEFRTLGGDSARLPAPPAPDPRP